MKIERDTFVKSWNIAERGASAASGGIGVLSTVLVQASEEGVSLSASDLKTSVKCSARGVEVSEPGEAAFPIKGVSDLFKKAAGDFTLQVKNGRAVMSSGRSKYRFSTYPAEEFPKTPSSDSAELFCSVGAELLSDSINKGGICASNSEAFPQYLSSAHFEMKGGRFLTASTDRHRLAICSREVAEAGSDCKLLVPIKWLRDFQRLLGSLGKDAKIKISYDDSQIFFTAADAGDAGDIEFAVRRIESSFPEYERLIPVTESTRAVCGLSELINAVDRIDSVVRDYNKTAGIRLSKDECLLRGRAPEFGEGVEPLSCALVGEDISSAFNTKFLLDALKVIEGDEACLSWSSSEGHMLIRSETGGVSFMCLIAPMEVPEEVKPFDSADDYGEDDGEES
ncbi:DNA polymerase III subunit beta [Synergistales bacterium]|nr:DNA polymerase III subunit beta [Synergistales bacterium]